MHCSSCGKPVVRGAGYCNHCGARLGAAEDGDTSQLPEYLLNFLLAGILGVPIAGLGILIGLMTVMKREMGFSQGLIVAFTLLSFLLLVAAECVFIWVLVQRMRASKKIGSEAMPDEARTRELEEATVLELPEPVASVTENTTRSFEPVYRKSKTP